MFHIKDVGVDYYSLMGTFSQFRICLKIVILTFRLHYPHNTPPFHSQSNYQPPPSPLQPLLHLTLSSPHFQPLPIHPLLVLPPPLPRLQLIALSTSIHPPSSFLPLCIHLPSSMELVVYNQLHAFISLFISPNHLNNSSPPHPSHYNTIYCS